MVDHPDPRPMEAGMSTAARRRGSQWELDVLRYVRSLGLKAERLHLAGRDDEGDIAVEDVGIVYVLECKNEKSINLGGYVTEAKVEALNYAKARGLDPKNVMPLAVVKRRNHGVERAYVITELAEFLTT